MPRLPPKAALVSSFASSAIYGALTVLHLNVEGYLFFVIHTAPAGVLDEFAATFLRYPFSSHPTFQNPSLFLIQKQDEGAGESQWFKQVEDREKNL